MPISNSVFCIITILFFVSCSLKNSDNKYYSEIFIDNSKIKESENITNRVDSISIIPLMEQEGNQLGSIFKLYISKNKIIVFDRLNTNKLLLFDNKGSFIKTIIKMGDGAQDPLNITDCWLNENNELEVYDYGQMKVYQFDSLFTLKNIVRSAIFNHFVSLSTLPGTRLYTAYANYSDFNIPFNKNVYQIAYLDSNLNVLNTAKNFDKIFQGITWPIYRYHFYKFKDTLRFVKSYDNIVYNISNNRVRERFKFIYKNNQLPDNLMPVVKAHLQIFKDRNVDPNIKAEYFKKFVRFTGLFLENDNYVFVSSRDTSGKFGNVFYSLIDKNSNKDLFSSANMVETEKYKLILPPFEFYDKINNEFISVVNGHNLKNLLFAQSPFQSIVVHDPNSFYLVKVKLK